MFETANQFNPPPKEKNENPKIWPSYLKVFGSQTKKNESQDPMQPKNKLSDMLKVPLSPKGSFPLQVLVKGKPCGKFFGECEVSQGVPALCHGEGGGEFFTSFTLSLEGSFHNTNKRNNATRRKCKRWRMIFWMAGLWFWCFRIFVTQVTMGFMAIC